MKISLALTVTAMTLAALTNLTHAIAQRPAPSAGSNAAAASATRPAAVSTPIADFARNNGFRRCAGAIALAELNLLSDSEYVFRPSMRPRQTGEPEVFSALVDARKLSRNHPAPRASLNLTVTQSTRPANACTTMYEQTVYHNAICQDVLAQMAPNGRPSNQPALGTVLVEVGENITLTLMPVGTAQCVTIIKEAAFDVVQTATPAAPTR